MKTNILYHGDNLKIMKKLESGKIDLIYIDPPFNSGQVLKNKSISFKDKFDSTDSYIHWLKPRLKECHRLLSKKGIFCLHLDYKSIHYAKIELDKIFGYNNLVNQIIWDYKKISNSNGKKFSRNHDVILVFSKTKKYTFNKMYESTLSDRKKQLVKSGYNTKKMNGEKYLYIYDDKNVKQRIKNGQFKESDFNHVIKVNTKNGNLLTDIFRINFLNSNAKEKLGYPTQKPLALLDRLIKAFTDKNDIVADFFCGCGTTISSAQNLNRKWLGCDISSDAINLVKKRMIKEHDLIIKTLKI